MPDEPHLLPYQQAWVKDGADIKIWEKSRRIGATYAQAYEDVRDALEKDWKVWFSSADESAAGEYIDYCAHWASVFDAAFEEMGETLIDEDKDVKALTIELPGHGEINALTSNTKRFRSKGGKAVWDEAAWHERPEEMWDALEPVTMWGHPMRILSTHNGKRFFYHLTQDVQAGRKPGSVHTVDIKEAVQQGLLGRIKGREVTEAEKKEWLDQRRARCRSEEQWMQEYMCEPVDEADAFLTYDMIAAVEDSGVLWNGDPRSQDVEGGLYLGFDVGRREDLSVIWIAEKVGPMRFTRDVRVMEKTPFRAQKDVLWSYLRHPDLRRACIDESGIGMQIAEEATGDFGRHRVEPVTFTNPVKEELAYALRRQVEEKTLVLPESQAVREDLHSVKKSTTAAGNIRFDVQGNTDGHADRFWAAALCEHAVSEYEGPVRAHSRDVGRGSPALEGYETGTTIQAYR
jgi:phage FluMu gp28-like protein